MTRRRRHQHTTLPQACRACCGREHGDCSDQCRHYTLLPAAERKHDRDRAASDYHTPHTHIAWTGPTESHEENDAA